MHSVLISLFNNNESYSYDNLKCWPLWECTAWRTGIPAQNLCIEQRQHGLYRYLIIRKKIIVYQWIHLVPIRKSGSESIIVSRMQALDAIFNASLGCDLQCKPWMDLQCKPWMHLQCKPWMHLQCMPWMRLCKSCIAMSVIKHNFHPAAIYYKMELIYKSEPKHF